MWTLQVCNLLVADRGRLDCVTVMHDSCESVESVCRRPVSFPRASFWAKNLRLKFYFLVACCILLIKIEYVV